MSIDNDTEIAVVRHPYKHKRSSRVRYKDIDKLFWSSVYSINEGDIRKEEQLNDYYLRCQFYCDKLLDPDYDHSCKHGPPPHLIYSFITFNDNKEIYDELVKLVGPKPKMNKPPRTSHLVYQKCAEEIAFCLTTGKEHPAIRYSKNLNVYYFVNSEMDPIKNNPNHAKGAGIRIKKIIKELLIDNPEWKEDKLGSQIAFKKVSK